MEDKKDKILKMAEKYEATWFHIIGLFLNRGLHGFFIFKRRKAEILAGATTFFILVSFCPILLLVISSIGKIDGDVMQAKQQVLETIKDFFPQVAPWIINSIDKIVKNQLTHGRSLNWINIVVLVYASLGFISSMMYAINSIAKVEAKGGPIIENIRGFFAGTCMWTFVVMLIIATPGSPLLLKFYKSAPQLESVVRFVLKYQIFHLVAGLTFFSLFYSLVPDTKVAFKDALLGAASFVSLFILGKSTYWIYLHYVKADLEASFGDFYTLIVAITWIYFLMTSFLYGAAVAYATKHENYRLYSVLGRKKVVSISKEKEKSQQDGQQDSTDKKAA